MLPESNCIQNPKLFTCETCDYVCSYISNYNKHLFTKKHQKKLKKKNVKKNPKIFQKVFKTQELLKVHKIIGVIIVIFLQKNHLYLIII